MSTAPVQAHLAEQLQFQTLFERYRSHSEEEWLSLLSVIFPSTPTTKTLKSKSTHATIEVQDRFATSDDLKKCFWPSRKSSASSRSCGMSTSSSYSAPDGDSEVFHAKDEPLARKHAPTASLESLGAQVALQVLKSQVPQHFCRVIEACDTLERELSRPNSSTEDGDDDDDHDNWVVVHAHDGLPGPNGDTGSWSLISSQTTPCHVAEQVMTEIYKSVQAPMTVSSHFHAYCPDAFQRLAEVRPWRLSSLRGPVESVSTSSRSGAWIFRSNDHRLVLKRISASEKDILVDIAQDYVDHVVRCKDSLLSPIFGCYAFC